MGFLLDPLNVMFVKASGAGIVDASCKYAVEGPAILLMHGKYFSHFPDRSRLAFCNRKN
jgi:hypothetical protein